MRRIDDFLNKITMYRLVMYGLVVIAGIAVVAAELGGLSFGVAGMVVSAIVILFTCYVTNWLFSWTWGVPSNSESWLITGLILFLILPIATTAYGFAVLAVASVISIVSKYVLTWHGRHVFNPAALAAAVVSLTAIGTTTWWVGNAFLWPAVLVIGLLIVRKIRRFPMVVVFVVSVVALQAAMSAVTGNSVTDDLRTLWISSPLIFFSTVMLSEPATMPPRRNQQLVFALLVALLYVPSWHLGKLYVYPEVALLLGNLYAFAVSPKLRLRLRLVEIQKISDRVYHYVFEPDRRMNFLPGQYMEWTLAGVPYDNRGNRRTFTIASSPTEPTFQVGLKYYQPSSAYKETFRRLVPGDTVCAGQLAGNFTLPGNETHKLAFVAGGIGITPFRSMIKYLIDTETTFDIALFYVVSDPHELAYQQEFAAAQSRGLRFIPITDGHFDSTTLVQELPDYQERIFYISGPHGMVESTRQMLRHLSVSRRNIKTDYFSGY